MIKCWLFVLHLSQDTNDDVTDTASNDDHGTDALKNGHGSNEADGEDATGSENAAASSDADADADEDGDGDNAALEAMLDDDEEDEPNNDKATLEQLMLDDDDEVKEGGGCAAAEVDAADDSVAVEEAAASSDAVSNSEPSSEPNSEPSSEKNGEPSSDKENGSDEDDADREDDGNEFVNNEEDEEDVVGPGRSRRNTPAPSSMVNAAANATAGPYVTITDDKLDAMMQYVGDDVPVEVLRHFLQKFEGDIEAAVEDYFESDGQIPDDDEGGFDDLAESNAVEAAEAEETLRMGTVKVVLKERPTGLIMAVNRAGLPMVLRVLPGSAGAKGGVQPDDQLVSMAGEPVEANAANYVVKTINSDGLPLPATLEFIRQDGSGEASSSADPVLTLKALVTAECGDDVPDDLAQYFLSEVNGDPDLAAKVYMEQKQGSPEKGGGEGRSKQRETPRPAQLTALLNGSAKVPVSVSPTASNHPSENDYEAILTGEALGMIVENMLENTVVVLVREGSAAEKAAVQVGSMILSVNARSVVNMTHAETLECIKGSLRPLLLRLRPLNEADLTQLREEMSSNRRQINPAQSKEEAPSSLDDVWPALYALLMVIEEVAPERHIQICEAMLLEGWEHDDSHDRGDGSLDAILNGEKQATGDKGGLQAAGKSEGGEGGRAESFTKLAEMINSIQHRSVEEEELLELLAVQLEPMIEVVTGVEYTEAEQPRDIFHIANAKESGEEIEEGEEELEGEAKAIKASLLNGVRAAFQMLETLVRFPNERVRGLTTDGMAQLLRTWRSVKQSEFVNVALPFVRRLAASNTEHLRVAASHLFGCVYVRLSDDQRVQLRSIIDRFAKDECSAVRRSTAVALPEIGKLAGHDCVEWVMGLFTKLSTDDAEVRTAPTYILHLRLLSLMFSLPLRSSRSSQMVRMIAVRNCIVLARLLPRVVERAQPGDPYRQGHLVECQVISVLGALAGDRDWQLRLLVANNCTELCLALGYKWTDVLVDLFIGLLRDRHVEVKTGTVLCLSGLGQCLITLAALEVRSLEETETSEKKREFESLMQREAEKQIAKNQTKVGTGEGGAGGALGFDPEDGEDEEVKESEEDKLRSRESSGGGTPPSSPAVSKRKDESKDGTPPGSPTGTPPGTPPDIDEKELADDAGALATPREMPNKERQNAHGSDEELAAGRAKIVQSVIPAMFSLTNDPQNQTQVIMSALIAPVMTMLPLLGRNHHSSMVPLLTKLLDNEFDAVSASSAAHFFPPWTSGLYNFHKLTDVCHSHHCWCMPFPPLLMYAIPGW
jgi:hypothetical protein